LKNRSIRVKTDTSDFFLAKFMLSDMAGDSGELDAAGAYFYYHTVVGDDKLSKLFMEIAMDELDHLNTFASLAFKYGADPRFWYYKGKRKVYWSPKSIQYDRKPIRMLKDALFAEYMTIEKYTGQMKQITDKDLLPIMEEITGDEREHARKYKAAIESLK
jgi:rubrerythrin